MDKLPTLRGVDAGSISTITVAQNSAEQAKTLKNSQLKGDEAALKAVKSFEALILHEMMKSMWSSVESTGLMGENSNEGQIYRDMFNQAIAETSAKGQGIGLQKVLLKDIQKTESALAKVVSKREGNAEAPNGDPTSELQRDDQAIPLSNSMSQKSPRTDHVRDDEPG